MIEFNKKHITKTEAKAISYWTSPNYLYRDIKKACENKYQGTTHNIKEVYCTFFDNLENLFTRYKDNTIKFETIYRCDIIENKDSEQLSDNDLFLEFCNQYNKNDIFKYKDMLCSFSSTKKSAITASKASDKYRGVNTPMVIYILENRISHYLYIAEFSQIPEEEEILLFGHKTFKVLNKKISENTIEIYMIEIDSPFSTS